MCCWHCTRLCQSVSSPSKFMLTWNIPYPYKFNVNDFVGLHVYGIVELPNLPLWPEESTRPSAQGPGDHHASWHLQLPHTVLLATCYRKWAGLHAQHDPGRLTGRCMPHVTQTSAACAMLSHSVDDAATVDGPRQQQVPSSHLVHVYRAGWTRCGCTDTLNILGGCRPEILRYTSHLHRWGDCKLGTSQTVPSD